MRDVKKKPSANMLKNSVFVSETDLDMLPQLTKLKDMWGLDWVLVNCWGFNPDEVVYDDSISDRPVDLSQQAQATFYTKSWCEHVNRQGKRVKAIRYCGIERQDKDWLEGGNASDEAKMFAKQDLSYLKEIGNLRGNGGGFN